MINPEDFLYAATCPACSGSGTGRLLIKEGDKRILKKCVCVRCEGWGIYDAAAPRKWKAVLVSKSGSNKLDDYFTIDDDLFSLLFPKSEKKIEKKPLKSLEEEWLFKPWSINDMGCL